MDSNQLGVCFNEIVNKCWRICEAKTTDYAKQSDIFSSLRATEQLGLCPVSTGILVRVVDKISRIINLLDCQNVAVKDESITDSIMDIINYLVLLAAAIKEGEVRKT